MHLGDNYVIKGYLSIIQKQGDVNFLIPKYT
jgi:hypothetical protein